MDIGKDLIGQLKKFYQSRGWEILPFQMACAKAVWNSDSGLVHSATGSGKTLALFMPMVLQICSAPKRKGVKLIWVSPVKALANDLMQAMELALKDTNLALTVGVRSGDTSAAIRKKMKNQAPDILITTPESLHLMISMQDSASYFELLNYVVVDEWHDMLGNKRGIQVTLALSYLLTVAPTLNIWSLTATIGNLAQGMEVVCFSLPADRTRKIISSGIRKQTKIVTVLPDEMDQMPWAGHMGVKLLNQVADIVLQSKSVLVYCNTRLQAELWYQSLLAHQPTLAGNMALHHGSLDKKLRQWVEAAIKNERIKVVVCTSTLDLGIDLKPVETVIQIGGPKGISRFLQRAGRSGHSPGKESTIYFIPTHALELFEVAGLRQAMAASTIEPVIPLTMCLDVAVQFLVTLCCSQGFTPPQLYNLLKSTFAFASIDRKQFGDLLSFLHYGGPSLEAYDEYKKLINDNGKLVIKDRKFAMRHRMNIGTISADSVLKLKYLNGSVLGTIEEYFVARLKPGDSFIFGGKTLSFVKLHDLQVLVRKSKATKAILPSWSGGRMPLSASLSAFLLQVVDQASRGLLKNEQQYLQPILTLQSERSHVPRCNEFLVEHFFQKHVHHYFFYTFEGHYVNEGLSALISSRLSKVHPSTFSISMNDYGFCIATAQSYNIKKEIKYLLSTDELTNDILMGLDVSVLAARKFRDIAQIAGLTFRATASKQPSVRYLQASSKLFFKVLSEMEPNHFLLQQAYNEVLAHQLDEARVRGVLQRISKQELVYKEMERPGPFAFPILVERMRQRISTEPLTERVEKLLAQYL
ncbi:MAG: hypothetical protein RIQ89_2010 [Bacteroidota bacterium]|jgi:ATP-dependent Lhr-like helicase